MNKDPHCYYCGIELTIYDSTLDHKLPRSKGGGNRRGNLVLCCIACNRDKGTMTAEEFLTFNGKSMTTTEE